MSSCLHCGHEGLKECAGFPELERVTSDCRTWKKGGKIAACLHCGAVQKPVDEEFQREADEIYATYNLYFQSNGQEQKIFTENGALPRSEALLRHILSQRKFPENCSLLDIGCGTGHLLQAMSRKQPHWQLFGADLHDHNKDAILSIRGVQNFFTGDISTIHRTFDMVVLSHVLEHIPAPGQFLKQVTRLLNPGGALVVLVPHWRDNFFDLLVADHCSHFAPGTLQQLLQRNGFSPPAIGMPIPKELCALAEPTPQTASEMVAIPTRDVKAEVDKAVGWLERLKDWAVEMNRQEKTIGIFGTALAATWLTRAAGLSPAFFVDEDRDRQGLAYLDRPVLSPAEVPSGSRVLIPLPAAIAEKIAARLNQASGETLFLAPAI